MTLPLLFFPPPQISARPTPLRRNFKKRQTTEGFQSRKIGPALSRLEQAFAARRMTIVSDLVGVTIEEVIVFETNSPIVDLRPALQKCGMEWLLDCEVDDFTIEDDEFEEDKNAPSQTSMDGLLPFQDDSTSTNTERGYLYLVMSDQVAMQQLQSLWQKYDTNREQPLPQGFAKFKDLFKLLHDVRLWGAEDRLRNTNLIEEWREQISDGRSIVRCEAELWFRGTDVNRETARAEFEKHVHAIGGNILKHGRIPEIFYEAYLLELPASIALQVLVGSGTGHPLFDASQVMFFRPVGQAVRHQPVGEPFNDIPPGRFKEALPTGDPLVAVLDGAPMENHAALAGRLIVDDPDDYSPMFQVKERRHGTSMCSLILHGCVRDANVPLRTPVYVRPIMIPNPAANFQTGDREEILPDNQLHVDIMHRALKRIFEGEGDEPPAAPSVRYINLSIGDRNRVFDYHLSPLARLLDWFAYKHSVLFIVSAGNYHDDISLSIKRDDFSKISPDSREQAVIQSMLTTSIERRLISPAEAVNVLTVGSTNMDNGTLQPYPYLHNLITTHGMASPYNRIGAGYARMVKPEVLAPGGRLLYQDKIIPNHESIVLRGAWGANTGHMVAAPSSDGLGITEFVCSRGTSSAAAITSRLAAELHEHLLQLIADQGLAEVEETTIPVLVKCLTGHAASWGGARDNIRKATRTLGVKEKEACTRLLGYGLVDPDTAFYCTDSRATIVRADFIEVDDVHTYEIPLPECLRGKAVKKGVSTTLAWFSPIRCNHSRYNAVKLEASIEGETLTGKTADQCGIQAASRGTLFHTRRIDQHAPIGTDYFQLKITCLPRIPPPLEGRVLYAVAVTVEDRDAIELEIYNEIRYAIKVPLQVRI